MYNIVTVNAYYFSIYGQLQQLISCTYRIRSFTNIKFHENPSIWILVVACSVTDVPAHITKVVGVPLTGCWAFDCTPDSFFRKAPLELRGRQMVGAMLE